MNESVSRIAAIVKADFWIRFRRISTVIIFLGLSIGAYLWIPDSSSGKALLQVDERRAVYNSAALGLATASLCTILLGLVAYYMVSSSIRRDIVTRTGFIIASTPVRNFEYLTGKFLGNVVYLSALVAGFMLSAMVMQLVRGEAPLQPLVFLYHYLILVPPMIVSVSVLAVVFECIPFLSGKFGDVAYFFVWMMALVLIAEGSKTAGKPNWASYFDISGLGMITSQFKETTHSDALSIGSSSYDQTKPPIVFEGLHLTRGWLLPRLGSTFVWIPLLSIAYLFFHRFNPAKLKASSQKAKHHLVARINGWIKPLTSWMFFFGSGSSGVNISFPRSVFSEMRVVFQLSPVYVFGVVGFGIAALVTPVADLQRGLLPTLFAVLAIVLADISTRESSAGTTGIIYASPYLKPDFVIWKFAAASLVTLSFTAIPFVKLLFAGPGAAVSLIVGSIFVAAAATSLGVMSSNPRTFIVVFLMFWYLALNDGGKSTAFDFAGWYGTATASVRLMYALAAAAMLAAAHAVYRLQQRRNY